MGVELFGAAEASLLEHYLDTVEHLPDDVQRTISLLREIDQKYQKILAELEQLIRVRDPKKRDIHRALVRTQELSDEKLQLMQQLVDTIENKSRQLESDARTLAWWQRDHLTFRRTGIESRLRQKSFE
ncbi:inhibitor of growth protein 3-like, partial [Tropilaelaps mercedesae]